MVRKQGDKDGEYAIGGKLVSNQGDAQALDNCIRDNIAPEPKQLF
jgi:hypothetical protein